jgi:uncharacterized membrane protein
MVFILLETQNHLTLFDNIIILMVGLYSLRRTHYVDNLRLKLLIYPFYAAMYNEIKTLFHSFILNSQKPGIYRQLHVLY